MANPFRKRILARKSGGGGRGGPSPSLTVPPYGIPKNSTIHRDFLCSNGVNNPVRLSLAKPEAISLDLIQAENAAIAAGLKRGDADLLDRLIDQYQHRLMRYLMFLSGRPEVAEDLFQETWVRVLLRGAQYNGQARFDTWLFTIARNLVIDLSRKRTMASLDQMQEPENEDDRPFEVAADEPSQFDHLRLREDSAEVSQAMLSLEANYREVITLRFFEEMALEEISKVTRAPLSTVKSRLYRGMAALKPEIERLRLRPVAVEVQR